MKGRITPGRIHDIAILYRITRGYGLPIEPVVELHDYGKAYFPETDDLMDVAYRVLEDSIHNGIGVVCRG